MSFLVIGISLGAPTLAVTLSSFRSPAAKNFVTLINWGGF